MLIQIDKMIRTYGTNRDMRDRKLNMLDFNTIWEHFLFFKL